MATSKLQAIWNTLPFWTTIHLSHQLFTFLIRKPSTAAEPTGSSSASDVPVENQNPTGLESGKIPELKRTFDPPSNDDVAERPVTNTTKIEEGLMTPTPAAEVVVKAEKSKSSKKHAAKSPWAKLLSQYPQNPHRVMRGSMFTVGRRGCDLCIKDESMPSVLCQLRQFEYGGPSVAEPEFLFMSMERFTKEICVLISVVSMKSSLVLQGNMLIYSAS